MNLLSLLVTQVTVFDNGRIGPTTLVALGLKQRIKGIPFEAYHLHRLIEAMLENYHGNDWSD